MMYILSYNRIFVVINTFYFSLLKTSLANEDTRPDQSIDEVDEMIRNEDMSCAINMAPLLLQEYRKLGQYF